MLRERYDPMNLFEHIPALGMETDAVLTQLDSLLDNDVLIAAVKADLLGRFPRTANFGRPSTPVEVILRMLVVKHLYHSCDRAGRAVGERQLGAAPVLPGLRCARAG